MAKKKPVWLHGLRAAHRAATRHHLRSKKLRKCAEEARTIAGTFTDAEPRKRMLAIAAEYDRMAEDAER